ncbi:MAG: AEC family transporter [Ruthenibacterium sp.]
MQMLTNSAVFIAIIVLGFVLKRVGLFKPADAQMLSKIIMNITLPAAIMTGFANVQFSKALLMTAAFSMLVNIVLLAEGAFFSRKKSPQERGLSIINANTFNTGNFAMPLLASLVSSNAFAGICMMDMGSSLFTFGPNVVFAQKMMGKSGKITIGTLVKRLLHAPTFVVYLIMLSLSVAGLQLPPLVLDMVGMAGRANSFLAMFCIGILFDIKFPKSGYKTIARILGGRYAVCTAAALFAYFVLPVPAEIARVIVLVLFAPIANCATMMTVENGCDGTLSAVINSLSMLISMVLMVTLYLALPV